MPLRNCPADPAATPDGRVKPSTAVLQCKDAAKEKVTLVEIVEVVARSPEGVVTGATAESAKMPTKTARTAKNGAAFKQYINIDKDVEGSSKRQPECGRYVEVKARIVCEGGSAAGKQVEFSYTNTPAAGRPALTGAYLEGFGSAGGPPTTQASTDAEGWTPTVKFYLSQYAGDQFKIHAEALDDKGQKKETGAYQVWRKFWYQVTRASTHAVPAPAKSLSAYETALAQMIAADEVAFEEKDAPERTFYPGWMVRQGGGAAKESVIGGHNRDHFYGLFKAEADKPVKGHLIICQHQWDPQGASALMTLTVKSSPSEEFSANLAWNAGVLSPALSGEVLAYGEWSGDGKTGALDSSNILVERTRTGLSAFRVKLPAGAPDPTKHVVQVKLKLAFGMFYGGESNKHHMLIVYRGDAATFNQAVAHEFGHGFGQTPRPGSEEKPLAKHAKQYTDEYGGVGSHCSTDATLVADTSTTSGKRYKDGTCIMFHQLNPAGCKQLFCATCEPHLRLRDMSTFA